MIGEHELPFPHPNSLLKYLTMRSDFLAHLKLNAKEPIKCFHECQSCVV